jgi:hypothetical protein
MQGGAVRYVLVCLSAELAEVRMAQPEQLLPYAA